MDINTEGQNILNVEINKEVRRSYIEYAMSVIVSRALPDVRDGLKPVHRRILYSMYTDHLTHDKAYRKSATTVGNVLGHYHPHGDAAVYDAMVRLAQDFSMRYPLVDGHGNFGNVDGDGAAAYRYTEARMSKISEHMLDDIEKDVVNFSPNFDNKLKEPDVLPAAFPNLLVNGSVGIAVGMATNIPPHNLTEVLDGTMYLMDHPDCEVLDLMAFIKGPDFPTYGTIHGVNGIKQAYLTGRGHVLVRAKHHFEESKTGKKSIVFTEIPYQVNKSNLVKSIADLVNDKRIDGIADLRDESGRAGMRIVIDLKRDANEMIVLNLLFKYTQLQDTCAMNMLALVGGEPKTLNLKQILSYYIKHREEVTTRRVTFDLNKAKAKMHIYEGYKIALDNIDEVVKLIRASKSVAEAKQNLIGRFSFTDIQAQAIVEMPLGKLSSMEVDNIMAELARLQALVLELEGILADESKIFAIMKEEFNTIKNKFGDERRTNIEEAEDEIVLEDLIEKHKCVVTITHDGYIKRIPADVYQAQNRGGKGINAMTTKEEDSVRDIFVSHSHNYILMFTNMGKLFIKKCYELPEASRIAKGTYIGNIINLREGESVTAFISVGKINTEENLIMATEKGIIKKCPLSRFIHIRKDGIMAIKLDEDDRLLFVNKTFGNSDIIIAKNTGLALKFNENRVRVMGRLARGVRAMRLTEGEKIVGCITLEKDADGKYVNKLLTLTENGFGKRTEIDSFPERNRGGKGIKCHKITEKTGNLAGIAEVCDEDDIMIITSGGTLIRVHASQISETGRAASGVIVMRTGEDRIVGFEKIRSEEEEEADENQIIDEGEGDIGDEDEALEDDAVEEEDLEEDEDDAGDEE